MSEICKFPVSPSENPCENIAAKISLLEVKMPFWTLKVAGAGVGLCSMEVSALLSSRSSLSSVTLSQVIVKSAPVSARNALHIKFVKE